MLAPNPDHLSAATSYRRARNALVHAKLSPWNRDRELESARFWRQSAEHHKSMAAFNQNKPVRTIRFVRQWHFPTWEQELDLLFSNAPAEVE
jgi:hypothetical protein